MKSHEQEARAIREYVLTQSQPGEIVKSAEKVHEEHVQGETYSIWDVRTRRHRWWVITPLTNLYLQRDMPSMDQALTVHIGLMARMMERYKRPESEERDRLAESWRRLEQAYSALDAAGEAEDYQAVGMRCREALISFIHNVADKSMVPPGEEVPKRSDFVHWSSLIAGQIAEGSSNERMRGYLKDLARNTWELVNWLTHAKNAVKVDATLAVEGTSHTLYAFGLALIRFEQGVPDRCPECASYRITRDWRPEYGPAHEYVTRCRACDWEDLPAGIEPDYSKVPEHVRPAIRPH